MRFQKPGGELTFWSILWMIFGLIGIYFGVTRGEVIFPAFASFVGLMALGMWFDQRWCGYLLGGFYLLVLPLGFVALFLLDATWGERGYRLLRIAMAAYFAWLCIRWGRGLSAEV